MSGVGPGLIYSLKRLGRGVRVSRSCQAGQFIDELLFEVDAAALTGLKYGCDIASLAVKRSWASVSYIQTAHIKFVIPGDHIEAACRGNR